MRSCVLTVAVVLSFSGQMVLNSEVECYDYILDDWKDQDWVVEIGYKAAIADVIGSLDPSQ